MHSEERLSVKKSDLMEVLSTLETIVASMDRIGACYEELGHEKYARTLVDFIEQWSIGRKLLTAREILSGYFSTELGDDDMDELERALHETPYWRRHSRTPPKDWRVPWND